MFSDSHNEACLGRSCTLEPTYLYNIYDGVFRTPRGRFFQARFLDNLEGAINTERLLRLRKALGEVFPTADLYGIAHGTYSAGGEISSMEGRPREGVDVHRRVRYFLCLTDETPPLRRWPMSLDPKCTYRTYVLPFKSR